MQSDAVDEEEGGTVAVIPQEIEIKGVHFKVCNPGVAECKLFYFILSIDLFTLFDFQPHHKLKDLRALVTHV